MLQWVEANPKLDSTRMWVHGFSQNSVWAIYTAYCFPQNFVGVYQGGATMSVKGIEPYALNCQSNVRGSDSNKCKGKNKCETCAKAFPCEECQYYPLYPCYNPERPMIDCSANYINDKLVYSIGNKSDSGRAWRMHEILKR